VRWLRQHTPVLQQQAELPSRPPFLTRALLKHYSVQQPLAPDLPNELPGGSSPLLEVIHTFSEDASQALSAFSELFLEEDGQGSYRNSAAEGVATVGTAMLVGLDAKHDTLVSEDR